MHNGLAEKPKSVATNGLIFRWSSATALVMRGHPLRIDPAALRARLTAARELGGLSCRSLSLLIGAAPLTVRNIESGHVDTPSADTLAAIAEALGVPLDWLAIGEGPAPTSESVLAAVAARRARAAAAETAALPVLATFAWGACVLVALVVAVSEDPS
jgi:transcriptional regulator with XRE-family HTH domain